VNNKSYENNASVGKDTIDVNSGRYFVKFLPSEPTVNRILWDQPVPDYIMEAPIEGWTEMPK
jgi:hypothetical protein